MYITANNEKGSNDLNIETEYQLINKITCNSADIIKDIATYNIYGETELGLKHILSNYLTAPRNLIQINSNIELKKVAIAKTKEENDLIKW